MNLYRPRSTLRVLNRVDWPGGIGMIGVLIAGFVSAGTSATTLAAEPVWTVTKCHDAQK